MLQGVELAFGDRGNSAGKSIRLASFSGRGLRQHRHDGETLSGLPAEGNRARARSRRAGAPRTGRAAHGRGCAQRQRPELLLAQVDVTVLGEEVELALLSEGKLKAAATA
jgi:hypothetical protein